MSPGEPRREPKHYQPPGLGALPKIFEAGCGRSQPENASARNWQARTQSPEANGRGVGDCNPEPAANDVEEPAEGTTTGSLFAAPHNTGIKPSREAASA